VNDACNLIRAATENDDVQINFGVVVDESMGDSVKITVIATGFQRDSLPEIDRRNPHFPFTMATTPAPLHAESAEPPPPEPEIVVQSSAPPEPEETTPADDYDTPAFLRRQKRMLQ
jgi:cell division protein FtsZ